MNIENIKLQISLYQRILDVARRLLKLQTLKERLDLIEMIRKIAKEFGLDSEVFLATIICESFLKPKFIGKCSNGTYDYGICAFNSYWYIGKGLISYEDAINPEKAVRFMAQRWKQGKARDWLCWRDGKYIPFLKVGKTN